MKHTNRSTVFTLLVTALIALWQANTRVMGFEISAARPITDYSIFLQIEQFKDYLKFPGSSLTPMVRVRVMCQRNKEDNEIGGPIAYEDLWYRGGDFVGCRRYRQLPIEQSDTVDFQMKFDNSVCTPELAGAASNASVRMLLDCSCNLNTLSQVEVPSENFQIVVAEMQRDGFYPYEKVFRDVTANIPMNLRSTDGQRLTLLYAETR